MRGNMKGLELAEAYYKEIGEPWLEREFPEYKKRICAGLVGAGSECFGFDDEYSRDHDFGPSFCLWLTKEDYQIIGKKMAEGYKKLPKEFMGFPARIVFPHGDGRVGVLEIDSFYCSMIGQPDAPDTLMDWLFLPEPYLAMATNGKVFSDLYGRFSSIRKKLLDFYPEDIRVKKIAARAAGMAQSGQYNYGRCKKRGESVAAELALGEFIRAAISMVYLLNRVYTPFYKWMHKGMEALPILPEIRSMLAELVVMPEKEEKIEEICSRVVKELRQQGLTDQTDTFLEYHANSIMDRIKDETIRSLPVMQG